MIVETLFAFLLSNIFQSFKAPNIPLARISNEEVVDFSMNGILQERVVNKIPVKIMGDRESLGIKTTAKSVAVVDVNSGNILYSKNFHEKVSIASLTKLMTALVFLDNNPGWNKELVIKSKYQGIGSVIPLEAGDTLFIKDLFDLMLLGSKNDAAMLLVDSTGMSQYKFVQKMNEKAIALGLTETVYVEPTGLSAKNMSSAHDIIVLLNYALTHEEIQKATTTRFFIGTSIKFQKKFVEANTNLSLLDSYLNDKVSYRLLGGKTGYITESGYCLASMFQNSEGDIVVSVVLGSEERDFRHQEVKSLVTWVYDNYDWQ